MAIEETKLGKGNPQTVVIVDKENKMESSDNSCNLLYDIYTTPPWYTCIVLGFQHYLTMFGSNLAIPLLLAPSLCMEDDVIGLSNLLCTIVFVSGIVTLLQTTFGVRLPIVQGGTFSLLTPAAALLAAPPYGKCPDWKAMALAGEKVDYSTEWIPRMQELQGAITVAAIVEVVIGFSGLIGILTKFVGPLAIAPTIALVGLSLLDAAIYQASLHWGIAFMAMALMIIFSQYMSKITVPCCGCRKGQGCNCRQRFLLFNLFPVILAVVVTWFTCFILTITNVFPSDPSTPGYHARTDINNKIILDAPWVRVPYPGQWGLPRVSTAGVLGMLAGIIASMIESIGDYYSAAKLSGAPIPPSHAISRGIAMEGIGCVIAGLIGSGNGTTSYSENIGAISVTRVGSRRVIQVGAIIMIFFGLFGKFGAIFVSIPKPIVGGMYFIMFAMIIGVGFSNLQHADMRSTRNMFVLGFSIFVGMVIPQWIKANSHVIATGSETFNQVMIVLLSTNMFVGGIVGAFLDNTIPGTRKERGLHQWDEANKMGADSEKGKQCYDLPFGMSYIRKWRWTKYVPFCPTFDIPKLQCKKGRVQRENA